MSQLGDISPLRTKYYVFVSYDSQDQARVSPIVDALKGAGFDVWWAVDIRPGRHWRFEIEARLGGAGCVVAIWSANSVESEWVLAEAEKARQNHVLVPVLIDPVQIPMGFAELQAANLMSWQQRSAAIESPSRLTELADYEFEKLVDQIDDVFRSVSIRQRGANRDSAVPGKGAGCVLCLIAVAAVLGLVLYVRNSQLPELRSLIPSSGSAVARPPGGMPTLTWGQSAARDMNLQRADGKAQVGPSKSSERAIYDYLALINNRDYELANPMLSRDFGDGLTLEQYRHDWEQLRPVKIIGNEPADEYTDCARVVFHVEFSNGIYYKLSFQLHRMAGCVHSPFSCWEIEHVNVVEE